MLEHFITLFLIFSFSLSLYLVLTIQPKKKLPPGPARFPIIGNINLVYNQLVTKIPPTEFFANISDKYGKICQLFIGNHCVVLINDYKVAKEVLNNPDFASRLYPNNYTNLYDMNNGIIFSQGPYWKEMRRFSMRTLKELGIGKMTKLNEYIINEFDEFVNHVKSLNYSFNLHSIFSISTVNFLWHCLSGQRFSHKDPLDQKVIYNLGKAVVVDRSLNSYLILFPFLRFIPHLTEFQELKKYVSNIQMFFKELILLRKRSGSYKSEYSDYMNSFLNEIDKGKPYYSTESLADCLVDLLFAGSDTTSTTLEWAVYHMLNNPHCLKEAQHEIDTKIPNRKITTEDKDRLPLIEATILEIIRLSVVLPFAQRNAFEDAKIEGFDIPKDSIFIFNILRLNLNKEVWGEDAEIFRPSRFISNIDGKVINQNLLINFGFGTRRCIGENLAYANLFIFYANLIQQFDFEGNPPSGKPVFGFTVSPQDFKIKLIPRVK